MCGSSCMVRCVFIAYAWEHAPKQLRNKTFTADEVAQQVKALATKPDGLGLIHEMHTWEERLDFPTLSSDLSTTHNSLVIN